MTLKVTEPVRLAILATAGLLVDHAHW